MKTARRGYWFLMFLAALALSGGRAAASCAVPANPIEAENCLPGNPNTEWDIFAPGANESISGFATDISVNLGDVVHFKVNSSNKPYRMDIYRLGWYGGLGARRVASLSGLPGIQQLPCLEQPNILLDCGNWSETASWAVPADAVSGIYLVKLIADDGAANHIIFIVRDDARNSQILFTTVDATWQAYNHWGGSSLYPIAGQQHPKVSYNRPFLIREPDNSSVFDHEYAMIRWLEKNGYDLSYFTHLDLNRSGSLVQNHHIFLMCGHDEYWSAAERQAVKDARDRGTNLVFLTGNNIAWKTRWEPSADGTNTPYRTLVCYKETSHGPPTDPMDPPIFTGLWKVVNRLPPSDIGPTGLPANELSGQLSRVGGQHNDSMNVTAADGKMRFWRGTSVASLPPGGIATFPQMLGYEWDIDKDNGWRHLATWRLSDTTVVTTVSGTTTPVPVQHNMTIYRDTHGAYIWATGTMQWSFGLDPYHNPGLPLPPERDIEQATVNELADMGVQPASLEPGLTPASPSIDVLAPTCVVKEFEPEVFVAGTTVTVQGTAEDRGGGVVGGVVVSFDGGVRWYMAEGRESWSFVGPANSTGPVKCRAVDDSGNLEGRTIRPLGYMNPVPSALSLEPRAVRPGSKNFSLVISGSGFIPDSLIAWNGQLRDAITNNPNMVRLHVQSADVVDEKTVPIQVFNPTPGGGYSQTLQFVVSENAALIGSERVYPNPWKANANLAPQIILDTLEPNSEVKLFTASARWIRSLTADDTGTAVWDLKNDAGQKVASGYYLYVIKDIDGNPQHGKVVVLR